MKTPEQYDKSVQSSKYRHQNDVKRHLYTSHHCKIESVQQKIFILTLQQGCQHLLAKKFQVISRFLAYFGPFFKVLLLFLKVPQSGKFPIGSYPKVKNQPKRCFQMVYDMSLR